MNSAQLLPAIRQLYSRCLEYFHHEPWELVHVLYSLNYTDDLAGAAEIAAAVEVACQGFAAKDLPELDGLASEATPEDA